MSEKKEMVLEASRVHIRKNRPWLASFAFFLSVGNTVCLLYYVHKNMHEQKTAVIREYIHEHVHVYQWVKNVHDPLGAWDTSRLYFEIGQYEEAVHILSRSLSQLSVLGEASIFWQAVLTNQIENIKNIQTMSLKDASTSTLWWKRWGITLYGPKKSQEINMSKDSDASREAQVQRIQSHYRLTSSAIGE